MIEPDLLLRTSAGDSEDARRVLGELRQAIEATEEAARERARAEAMARLAAEAEAKRSPAPSPQRARRRGRRWVAAIVGTVIVATAGGTVLQVVAGGADAPLAPAVPVSPYRLTGRGPYTSVVATATGASVEVYAKPGDRQPIHEITNPTESGAPAVFLVTDESDDEWLSVFLPIRPNGSQGWIRRDQASIGTTEFRVRVLLEAHVIEVYQGEQLALRAPIAVGKADTPTPGGRFFITELVEPLNPDTLYGTHAFGLSGFSNTIREFNGGAGVVGIHGTNDPASLGKDVSSGCIRLRNEDIANLVGRLPLGTPVEILS